MPGGRPIPPLQLSGEVKTQLETIANSRTLPYAQVRRAQIILMSAQGLTNTVIAKRVGLSIRMVGIWRQRFIDQGLMGLYDQPRAGAPRSISDEQVAELIKKRLTKNQKAQPIGPVAALPSKQIYQNQPFNESGVRLIFNRIGKNILRCQRIPILLRKYAILLACI